LFAGPGNKPKQAESPRLASVGRLRSVAGQTKNGSGDELQRNLNHGGSPQYSSLENGQPGSLPPEW